MRLFVAVDLPDAVRREIAPIGGGVAGARWTKPAQLHFTMRFLGERPAQNTAELKRSLSALSSPAFSGRLAGTGRFPRRGPARILWAGFSPVQPMIDLQLAVESAVRAAGTEPEEKPFSPHVTLARLRDASAQDVEAFLERTKDFATAEFPVDSVVLYSSVLAPAGPTYREELIVRLGG